MEASTSVSSTGHYANRLSKFRVFGQRERRVLVLAGSGSALHLGLVAASAFHARPRRRRDDLLWLVDFAVHFAIHLLIVGFSAGCEGKANLLWGLLCCR